MESFVFDPLLPAPLLAALWVLAALAALAYVFWRPTRLPLSKRLALGALHLLPCAGLIVLLYRPSIVTITGSSGGKPVLSVFVDSSASMATDDTESGTDRFRQAVTSIKEHLPAWTKDFEVRLHVFDGAPRSVADAAELERVPPNGSSTDLAAAVQAGIAENPKPAIALLISDGIHNASSDLQAAARSARAAGVPFFTCAIGSDVAVKDIGVVLSGSEELAFVGQKMRIPVTITQTGFDNTTVEAELQREGKIVDKKSVRFEKGAAEVSTEFTVSHDSAGLFVYEIVVPPRKNEAVTSNNRRRMSLRVVNERIAILFLEGKPYWDSKFLVRVLRRDPNVLLTTALQIRGDKVIYEPPNSDDEANAKAAPAASPAPSGKPPELPRDPVRPLEDRAFLGGFQVVMLGRDADAFLTPAAIENLREWVARSGGHLVCTRGRPVQETTLTPPLAALLPVAWKTDAEKHLQVKLTERGRALALFEAAAASNPDARPQDTDPSIALKSLPSLVTATSVDKERTLTVVLARGEDNSGQPMAILSVQNYGAGKSVVMEGQGMWRWGFRPPDDTLHGEDVFHAFWTNMIRWLAGSNEFLPSQNIVLRPGKPLYQPGERPVLYVLRREAKEAAQGPALTQPRSYRIDINGGVEGKPPASTQVIAQPVPREANMFQAELDPLDEGQYTARLVDTTPAVDAAFEVLPPLRERLDLRARPDLLQELSALTDARALDIKEFSTLGTLYRDFVKQHKPGSETKRPAWDQPWILGLFLAGFGLAWWTRRKWGAI